MKTISLLLLVMLSPAAGAATTDTNRYSCAPGEGKCPPLPAVPEPPVPPSPPVPPVPPALPVLPVPPAPPPLPTVPAGAHAACAGKHPGTALTYTIAKGETMTGTCERGGGKMMFSIDSYSRRN